MTKNCIRCGQAKPLAAFYRHAQMRDGHLNKCIECCLAYSRQRYIENPGLDKRGARPINPSKRRARNAARVLPSRPCEVCGASPAQRHHVDYDEPLSVRWLCRRHHGEAHRRYAA